MGQHCINAITYKKVKLQTKGMAIKERKKEIVNNVASQHWKDTGVV